MQQIIKRKTNVDWLIYKMGHKLIFVFQSASVFIQFKTSVFIYLLIFKCSSVYLFMYQLAKVKMKKKNNMNKYILK